MLVGENDVILTDLITTSIPLGKDSLQQDDPIYTPELDEEDDSPLNRNWFKF